MQTFFSFFRLIPDPVADLALRALSRHIEMPWSGYVCKP